MSNLKPAFTTVLTNNSHRLFLNIAYDENHLMTVRREISVVFFFSQAQKTTEKNFEVENVQHSAFHPGKFSSRIADKMVSCLM